jgi:hypothetical protein
MYLNTFYGIPLVSYIVAFLLCCLSIIYILLFLVAPAFPQLTFLPYYGQTWPHLEGAVILQFSLLGGAIILFAGGNFVEIVVE